MNAAQPMLDWTEANQRFLTAEFARLQARLARSDDQPALSARNAAAAALPAPAAIDRLAEIFALTAFERDLLLLAAGVEMDARIGALCADAQGHPPSPWASFGLALDMLDEPHWSAMLPSRPLRRWRLIDIDLSAGLASGRLRIEERVLHFLAGLAALDTRLEPLLRSIEAPAILAPGHRALADGIAARLAAAAAPLPVVLLYGPDAEGREDVAADCAAGLGLRLYRLATSALPSGRDELALLATLLERESALGGAALLLDAGDEPMPVTAVQFVEQLHGVVFLGAYRATRLRRAALCHEVLHPSRDEQRRLWEDALGAPLPVSGRELDGLAMQFCCSTRSIVSIAVELTADDARCDAAALWRACRRGRPGGMSDLAQRIEPAAGWASLVLPDAQHQVLAQIVTHMRHRFRVYHEWGFAATSAAGVGVSVLFAGESGTGKTLAAEVLATELQLDLYRIDLAAVVSKYIGETEKNLRQVFDVAEDTGAMLLFDEADALFGKRSEVKDSHDRYANIEVSYLLQRMEAFRGLAILTTNHKSSLDSAFLRRLRFVVNFAHPDQRQREAIWRVAFPTAMPRDQIDCARLARLNATGGTIRNIAVAAAFLAAERDAPVAMVDVLRAAHLDAGKRDKPLSDAETRGWI